ncbi:MAG: hypothetical protein GY841_00495 [FCB group bacterium]|nr:hypothetical protein [FCB group bacterium]
MIFAADWVVAAQIVKQLSVQPEITSYETGLKFIAVGSDSVLCSETLLDPTADYTLNLRTGVLALKHPLDCDRLTVIAFQLPDWMTASAGNKVPPGKRLIQLDSLLFTPVRNIKSSSKKINLSGNKSFSFNVGRSGSGRFSQGLNLDFDALIADDMRLRGSVSDRIGSTGGILSGGGGTTILSELDKYFFEIEGRRVVARGGDIETTDSRFLPNKRIRGISAAYRADAFGMAVDVGRPAGKFISQRMGGVDGRQGPYQAVGQSGRPVGIVPGSEKVYIDGRRLEGGSDRHYFIDYPAGRMTFSPTVLITSRSRIEVDFEAAENDYEQAVYDFAGKIVIPGKVALLEFGVRRETDEQDRPRFGAFSETEIDVMRAVGDSTTLAFRSGVRADTAGNYIFVTDTTAGDHYLYVGGGGDYSVSFSYAGEGLGDYRYLGDGIYEYNGYGGGGYLPLIPLPLPARNDFIFGALEITPYRNGTIRLSYQGNSRDNNLFSDFDDNDNYNSQAEISLAHQDSVIQGRLDFRYREESYNPVSRLNLPDFDRVWALPVGMISGDEFRLESHSRVTFSGNRLSADIGYIKYRDNLESKRVSFKVRGLGDLPVSPRASYTSGNSERTNGQPGDGLYEKYNAGAAVKAIRSLRVELDYDRELTKDRYDLEPDAEKYSRYRAAAFYRNTVLIISRRIDFTSAVWGVKGPQLDKIEIIADENVGRLKIRLAGTALEQKRLDSQREDRSERLYQATFRYASPDGWLTVQADYRQNRRGVRSTGELYLRVGNGEGDYRFEDDRYLYDPDGDYIRIKEETGGFTSVSTGEKSHNITLYPGRFKALGRATKWLSQTAFRLRTELIEELPGDNGRRLSWVVPWASRSDVEYLSRSRREGYSVLLFPAYNFYILNFSFSNHFTEQEAGSQLSRSRKEYKSEIKNSLSPQVRTILRWRHRRGNESGIGLVALILRENEYTAGLIINQGRLQMTPRVSYVRIDDELSGGDGRGVWIGNESVFRQAGRGEIRFDVELRSLTEKQPFSQPEYLVTDGKRFGKSALINLTGSYDLGKSMRMTINLTDRIFEGRAAEFTGRGELVARF